MNKNVKFLIAILVLCIPLCLFSACQSDAIVGDWVKADGDYSIIILANSNGTITFKKVNGDIYAGTWQKGDAENIYVVSLTQLNGKEIEVETCYIYYFAESDTIDFKIGSGTLSDFQRQ